MLSSIIRPSREYAELHTLDPTCIRAAVVSAAYSDRGGRDQNEDRSYRCDTSRFYMVVDGMGGHRGGALASQIAVETIPDEFTQRSMTNRTEVEIENAFRDAVCRACSEMATVGSLHDGYDRMGCTLAAASVRDGHLYYSNVGDCRVYLYHNRKLKLLSHDETLVQQMVDNNLIDKKKAITHRWRHIVTNSVNARGLATLPDLSSVALSPGDVIVLTSDGLTNELTDHEIESELHQSMAPAGCVSRLITTALDRHARDNVSCVVIRA